MFAYKIHNMAASLIRLYGKDPYAIAEGLGIKIIKNYDFKSLYGMYTVIKRRRIIILNGNLDKGLEKTVLAHELGHDRMHRNLAVSRVVHDVMLYDMTARPEYEANMFAAELLVSDDEILELMREYGYSTEQTAGILGFNINLIGIKLMSMNMRGFEFSGNITADCGFLSNKSNPYKSNSNKANTNKANNE